jgi:hypothetical protein
MLAAAAVTVGAPPGAAATGSSGVYLACPDVTTLAVETATDCESLSDALSDAVAYSNTVNEPTGTVELLPGDYCPVSVPYSQGTVRLVGTGFAGLADPSVASSYQGFEAALSTFTWTPQTCAGTSSQYIANAPGSAGAQPGVVSLANLAITAASGGPSDGVAVTGARVLTRDVMVSGLSDVGLSVQAVDPNGPDPFGGADIAQSAFIDDGIGTSAGKSELATISTSTYAGNSVAGVGGAGIDSLSFDTVAHNAAGLTGTINSLSMSIVGDNDTTGTPADCPSTYTDGGGNVLAADCAPQPSDASLTSSLGSLSTGAPDVTPSIAPPTEAGSVPQTDCQNESVDQEQGDVATSSACDAGSVDPGATSSLPSAFDQDFGAVPVNEPTSQGVWVTNHGGVVGTLGVATSVTGGSGAFAVTGDTCTYGVTLPWGSGPGDPPPDGYCLVTVTATSTATSGATSGQLVVHTTAGDVTVPLSATGAPAASDPGAPTGLRGRVNGESIRLTWKAPVNDGGQPVTSYRIERSTDRGATWTLAAVAMDTTVLVDGLTAGRSYEFRVEAKNGFGYSVPSAVYTRPPPKPLRATVAWNVEPKTTLRYGDSIELSARVVTSHGGVGDARVELLSRHGPHGRFTLVRRLTADSFGGVSVTVTPKRNTTYEWTYAGSPLYLAATSKTMTFSVSQIVHAAITRTHVKVGQATEIYGTVTPSARGRVVHLQNPVEGGGVTNQDASGSKATIKRQRMPNGKVEVGFILRFVPSSRGFRDEQNLGAAISGTARFAAGSSNEFRVAIT